MTYLFLLLSIFLVHLVHPTNTSRTSIVRRFRSLRYKSLRSIRRHFHYCWLELSNSSFRDMMFALSTVILLLVASFSRGQSPSDRPCAPDTVDFASKVEKSSIVVYGKAMAKMLTDGSDETFHVFFQVDCILKGPATLRQINITNAGTRVQEARYRLGTLLV